MRKLGGETPKLSASRWLLLFERKSLLWLREAIGFNTSKQINFPEDLTVLLNSQRKWTLPHLWPPPVRLRRTRSQSHATWLPTRSPNPCGWSAALPCSAHCCFDKPQWSLKMPLLKVNHASDTAWKEKTFVINLSLQLSPCVPFSLTKKQNTCKHGIPSGPCMSIL